MRIVFAGTPEVALPTLRALVAAGHEIALVVTREDAPRGRKRELTPSEVAAEAEQLGIPVLKANRLGAEAAEHIAEIAADIGVVVAYGALLREPLLSAPKHGWMNVHFSMLPRWRGAAPVQHALIAGDTEIGVSVFQLEAGLDTGPVVAQRQYPIPEGITAGELLAELAQHGAALLVETVQQIEQGAAVFTPQSGDVTFAPKLTRDSGRLVFSQPAEAILHRWAGVTPEPGAYAEVGEEQVKLLEMAPAGSAGDLDLAIGEARLRDNEVFVGTTTQAVRLLRVQPAGKQGMLANDWLRGRAGSVFFSGE